MEEREGAANGEEGVEAIVIGASAGAVAALTQILPMLPREMKVPVLVVVHLPPQQKSALAGLFASKCQVPVKEAEDKEPIEGGTIYFAPSNYHLLVEQDLSLALSSDEPVNFSRPAIDVLFESAADAYGDTLAGVVLTGGNHDGAKGLEKIAMRGGMVVVQSPETAEMPVMPQAALAACPGALTLTLTEIGKVLGKLGAKEAAR